MLLIFFFFNDTATTEIYTLSLHDALPIFRPGRRGGRRAVVRQEISALTEGRGQPATSGGDPTTGSCVHLTTTDRKSTRLNSSHANISYAVFCLKKKKKS